MMERRVALRHSDVVAIDEELEDFTFLGLSDPSGQKWPAVCLKKRAGGLMIVTVPEAVEEKHLKNGVGGKGLYGPSLVIEVGVVGEAASEEDRLALLVIDLGRGWTKVVEIADRSELWWDELSDHTPDLTAALAYANEWVNGGDGGRLTDYATAVEGEEEPVPLANGVDAAAEPEEALVSAPGSGGMDELLKMMTAMSSRLDKMEKKPQPPRPALAQQMVEQTRRPALAQGSLC